MAKPTRLRYTGKVREVKDEAGSVVGTKVDRFFAGVPARDLDEADIALLEPDVLKSITGGDDPLYVDASLPAKDEPKAEAKGKP